MPKAPTNPHIEVILPIYNEVQNIQPLIKELDKVQLQLKGNARLTYLFVNDGSKDGSAQLLQRLRRDRSDIRVVDLVHNFGHGPALAAGIDHFAGDIAVIMDADLQDPPSSILNMFEAWKQGHRTVVAERGSRQERAAWLFETFYWLLHKLAPSLPRIRFGTHSLLDKAVIHRLRQYPERHRYLPGLVSLASNQVVALKFDRGKRANGKSQVGAIGLLNLALTAIVSFSSTPVRLVSAFGLLASLVALTSAAAIVAIKLFTNLAIPGWASTLTAIFFGNGVQLLCIGLIGEYVARIYDESKNRPLYLVERVWEPRRKGQENAA